MESASRGVELGHIDRGVQSELEISADLIRRGFAVFRNQSPQGPVDLVAMSPTNGSVLKIQATTASQSGMRRTINYNRHPKDPHWDVLAVRFPGEIRYFKRSGGQINPTSRGARTLLRTLPGEGNTVRPSNDPNDDPSRRRYLIALAVRELGPDASPYARRRAVRQGLEAYRADRNLDKIEKAFRAIDQPPTASPVSVEPGSGKPPVAFDIRAEIIRKFGAITAEQQGQPIARDPAELGHPRWLGCAVLGRHTSNSDDETSQRAGKDLSTRSDSEAR